MHLTVKASLTRVGMDEPRDEPRRRRPNPTAVFETSLGTFRAEIFADRMPLTASNFLDLAQRGFYDGLHVHRVVPKMALVFGCPYSRDAFSPRAGQGFPPPGSRFATWTDGRPVARDGRGAIVDEFPMCPRLSNHAGTLAMCNLGERDSCGSQFFVNVAHNLFLDFFDDSSPAAHPVFGRLLDDGLDLAKKIAEEATVGPLDAPATPVEVVAVTVDDPDAPPPDPGDDPVRMGRQGPGAALRALLADDG